MAIWHVDYINGSSVNGGTSWVDAVDKIVTIPAASISAGDEIRIAQTSEYESTGIQASIFGRDSVISRSPKGQDYVSTASFTSPILVTSTNDHKLVTGEQVAIINNSNIGSRGIWKVQVVDNKTFYLNGSAGTSAGTGGYFYPISIKTIDVSFPFYAAPLLTSANWKASVGITPTPYQYLTAINGENLRIAGTLTGGPKKLIYTTLPATADLSAYSIVNILYYSTAVIPAGDYRIALCSDTLGDVVVSYIDIPSDPQYGTAIASKMSVDFGGPLPSGINSIALYSGVATPKTYFYLGSVFFTKDPEVHLDGFSYDWVFLNPATNEMFDIISLREGFAIVDGREGHISYFDAIHEASSLFTLFRMKKLFLGTYYENILSQNFVGLGTVHISGGWNTATNLRTGASVLAPQHNTTAFFNIATNKAGLKILIEHFYCVGGFLTGGSSGHEDFLHIKNCSLATNYATTSAVEHIIFENVIAKGFTVFCNLAYRGKLTSLGVIVVKSTKFIVNTNSNYGYRISINSLYAYSFYSFLYSASTSIPSYFSYIEAEFLELWGYAWQMGTCIPMHINISEVLLVANGADLSTGFAGGLIKKASIKPTSVGSSLNSYTNALLIIEECNFYRDYFNSYNFTFDGGKALLVKKLIVHNSTNDNVYLSGALKGAFVACDFDTPNQQGYSILSDSIKLVPDTLITRSSTFSWKSSGYLSEPNSEQLGVRVGRYFARAGVALTFFCYVFKPLYRPGTSKIYVNKPLDFSSLSVIEASTDVLEAWIKLEISFIPTKSADVEIYFLTDNECCIDDIQGEKCSFPISDALWVGSAPGEASGGGGTSTPKIYLGEIPITNVSVG